MRLDTGRFLLAGSPGELRALIVAERRHAGPARFREDGVMTGLPAPPAPAATSR